MTNRRRLTRPEIEILRRSVGASGQLPMDQLIRLLEETALLLEELDSITRIVTKMAPPWRDVRGALNEMHKALHVDERSDSQDQGSLPQA